MAYVFLVLAIAVEVIGTSLLRSTEGFTRVWPSAACLTAYALSIVLLALTVRTLPVGVIYAAAIVAVSATFLGESLTPSLIVGVVLIIAGVVIVNLSMAH
jgi:small multidrug resistance pump